MATDPSSIGGNMEGHAGASMLNNTAPNPIDGGNQWFPYFGEPNGEMKLNVYDRYKHETYDLPEAYKGQCLYLRDTMDGLIVEGNDWYTTVALPWVQTEHMHIAWNEFHFNQTLAGRVPHEGVSRLISSSKRGHKESVVRRGIAMVLEHGFMNTPEGQEQYRRNLVGIRTCVQETANHDVMQAYLTCKRFDREWQAKHGYQQLDLRRVFEHEVNSYMLVQKSPDGLDIMVEQMRQAMSRHGVTPNMIIFPPGMSLHLTMVNPEQTEYWVAGPEGTKVKKQGPRSLTNFRGMNVFETRTFDVAEDVPPIDLLRQNRCVGEYYLMRDEYKAQGVAGYHSCHRDIVVYNESTDNWHKLSLKDAIDSSGVFTNDGLSNDLGGANDDNNHTPGLFRLDGHQSEDKPGAPHISPNIGGHKIKLFGDIHPRYMSRQAVKRVAASAANAFAGRSDLTHVPQELTALWNQINEAIPVDASYARYLSRSFASVVKAPVPQGSDGQARVIRGSAFLASDRSAGPRLGIESFPAPGGAQGGVGNDAGRYNFTIPIGFGSFAGFKQLATHAGLHNSPFLQMAQKTNDLMSKFAHVHNHVRRAFPESRIFDDKKADVGSGFFHLPKEDGATLFDNCVATVGDPLWLDGKIYGLAVYPTSGQEHELHYDPNTMTFNGTPFAMHIERAKAPSASDMEKIAALDAIAALRLAQNAGYTIKMPDAFRWPDLPAITNMRAVLSTIKPVQRLLYSNHYHRIDGALNSTDPPYDEANDRTRPPLRESAKWPEPHYPYLPKEMLEVNPREADSTSWHEQDAYRNERDMGLSGLELAMPLCSTNGMRTSMLQGRAHLMHPFRFGTPVQSVGMEPQLESDSNAVAAAAMGSRAQHEREMDTDMAIQGDEFVLTGTRLTHPDTFGGEQLPASTGGHNRLGNTSFALTATEWSVPDTSPDQEALRARKRQARSHRDFDHEQAADGFFGAPMAAGAPGRGGDEQGENADGFGGDNTRTRADVLEGSTNNFHRNAWASELGIATEESRPDPNIRFYAEPNPGGRNRETSYRGETYTRTKHMTLHKRWVQASADPNDIDALYQKAFLLTPVSKRSLYAMVNENVVVPFNFVLARPFIQHEMSSVIMTVAGQDTGATFFGHSDFQLADDVTSKVHYGNFTFYSKALVTNPKNVHMIDGVFAQNYVKGNDCTFFHPDAKDDADAGGFDSKVPDAYHKSIFSMVLPYEEGENMPNPIDLTGTYHSRVASPEGEELGNDWQLSGEMQKAEHDSMFSTLPYYARRWKWGHASGQPGYSLPGTFQPGMRARANTVCFQGHQFSWCKTGSGMDGSGGYTNVVSNTGHFGPDVYPGCGMVRRGQAKVLEKQGWNRCSVPV